MSPNLRKPAPPLSPILITISIIFIRTTEAQGAFVARHNLPKTVQLPGGYVRASDLANSDGSASLTGPVRPLGQLPLAQDTGSIAAASQQQQPPKDPFQPAAGQPQQSAAVIQPPQSVQSQEQPSNAQIQALIDSERRLPGKSPMDQGLLQAPVGPPVDPNAIQAQQPQQVVYVPVPVQVQAQPVATVPPPPPNLPSWMTHPLSGNLPWNGRRRR